MSGTEKKIGVLLVVVLLAMVAVYVSTANKPAAGPLLASPAGRGPTSRAGGEGAACPTGTSAGGYAKTEELGKAGAKVDIIAVVPVALGCHATTVAELKKAYNAHENDIHLTIVDKDGPDAGKYAEKVGSPYTRVTINGKYQFEVNGQQVALEKGEGMTYSPADLAPIIEQELKK